MLILILLGIVFFFALFGLFIGSIGRVKKMTIYDNLPVEEEQKKKLGFIEGLDQKLVQSGAGINVQTYLLIIIVSAVVIYFASYFLCESMVISIFACAFSILIPNAVIEWLKKKHQREFDSMFIKVLKRMAATLRAGSTPIQAVEDIMSEPTLPKAITEEFLIVYDDYIYSRDLSGAFYKLFERTGSEDVKSVALSIQMSSQYGTALYEVFERYVNTINARKELEAEGKAELANTKMTARVAGASPFLLGAAFKAISPNYFDGLLNWGGGFGKTILVALYGIVIFGYIYLQKKTDIKI